MASANDSQGLKIAVAIFVSLTVILSVMSYFLYTEYSKAAEQLVAARTEASQANQKATQANTNLLDLRNRAGYTTQSEAAAILQAIDTDQQALVESLQSELGQALELIGQAQQQGATGPEVERYRNSVMGLIQTFGDESTQSPTLKGSLETLATLTANQANLATSLASDNVKLRRQLENVDNINEAELTKQAQASQESQSNLAEESRKYEGLFNEQRDTLDQLQRQVSDLRAENDRLESRLVNMTDDYTQKRSEMLSNLRKTQDQLDKTEVILENADGYVTFVDYSNRRIRTNLTRSMGARPQMILSVFDANAPGLPSDRPKARVKLLEVGDKDSVALIEEQFEQNNPLATGDQLYSAAWSPNRPQRFALIGKIDMNRDGRDDREDLKRLIAAAGGVVDFDHPLPIDGAPQGELNPLISYYIVDERDPIRTPSNMRSVRVLDDAALSFAQDKTELMRQAREYGIRPLPVERLLDSLGYSFGMLIPGGVEAADRKAIENILDPEGSSVPQPGTEEYNRRLESLQQQNTDAPF